MPIYEYRCRACEQLTDKYFPSTDAPTTLTCKHCNSDDTHRIISGAVYHPSEATKTAKLDPRYERLIDQTMRKSSAADPERILSKMKPFPKKK